MIGNESPEVAAKFVGIEFPVGLVPGTEHLTPPGLVSDLGEQASHLVLVGLVVELLQCLEPRLVTELHVPGVGQRVVVKALLVAMHVDSGHVDQTVRGAPGVAGSNPRARSSRNRYTSASGTSTYR